MKRSVIAKILVVLLTMAFASSVAGAAQIDGGGSGGGLSGAGTGNF